MTTESFVAKLQRLLDDCKRSQAWLAEQAGVPSSTVSRVLSGTRPATVEVIVSMVTTLGHDPWLFVQGTDAEARLAETAEWVRRADFVAMTSKLGAYEARINEVEEQLATTRGNLGRETERRRTREQELGEADLRCTRLTADLEDARATNHAQAAELRRHRQALSRAVAEIAGLHAQMRTLAGELKRTKQTTRVAAILAGVAALTGVVSASQYLRRDDDDESAESDDDEGGDGEDEYDNCDEET